MKYKNICFKPVGHFIKDTILVLLSIVCLVCAFYGFYEQITDFFTKWLLPLVDFRPNSGTDAAVVVASVALMLWALMKGPKRYSLKHLGILAALWFLFINYWIKDDFVYTKVFGVPYFLLLLLLPSLGMLGRFLYFYRKHKAIEFQTIEGFVQKDEPIEEADDDILGFTPDVKFVMDIIEHTVSIRSTSIGLNAPWGTGKTSFLNLLSDKIKNNDRYIFIEFNPRGSAKVENIQADFMGLLRDKIKGYHSSFSSLLKKYVSTLRLIDKQNPLADWISHLGLDSVETSRDSIKDVIVGTRKKLVVLIDDLDRLTAKEILEVFKLIDINSSFPNSFFITAYDKNYVNGVLVKELGYEVVSNYTDKYFSIEYMLPEPSYSRKFGLLDSLMKGAISKGVLSVEQADLSSLLTSMQSFCETLLPNLRDIKRFYNQFISTYVKIGRDVDFKEYFALSLIRYAYPDEYRNLALKKYVEKDHTYPFSGTYILNDKAKEAKSIKLLEILFPLKKGERPTYLFKDKYHHINYSRAFDTYFRGFEIGGLYYEDLSPLLDVEKPLSIVQEKFEKWQTIGEKNDIVDYLLATDFRKLDGEAQLKRYVQVLLMFTHNYGLDLNMSTALFGIFSSRYISEIEPHYGLNRDAYKSLLETAIYDLPSPVISANYLNWFVVQKARQPELYKDSLFSVDDISQMCHSNLLKMAESSDVKYDPIEYFIVLEGCIVKYGESPQIEIRRDSLEIIRNLVIEKPEMFAPILLTHITQYNDNRHIYLGLNKSCHLDMIFVHEETVALYLNILHKAIGEQQPYKTLAKYLEFAKGKLFEWHQVEVEEGKEYARGDYEAYYSLMVK